MTSLNQRGQRIDEFPHLIDKLEKLGAREIYLWKAMVLREESLFSEVYQLIYCDNPRIAWHAAWVIDHVSEDAPEKLEPHVHELIEHLPNLKSSSLKRHFTRMLLRHEIPKNLLGMLIDVLYNLLSPIEAIAVRANALQLLFQIAMIEPGLKSELISVTESILEEELTPGMNSKGKKILKALRIQ
jgi:hypothetical protein